MIKICKKKKDNIIKFFIPKDFLKDFTKAKLKSFFKPLDLQIFLKKSQKSKLYIFEKFYTI